MNRARLNWRKFVSNFMLTMTGLCALISVSALFFILGYLLFNGGTSINWAFFTQLPKPVGETGGGMANAIVGSAKLLLAASLLGVPIGFFGGIYLAEFSGGFVASIVRYSADLLNGVPSIVIGIFAYSMVVLPFKHFSTLAGAFALGIMMIPITLRSTEEFLKAVPRQFARRRHGPRRQQVENHLHGDRPRCLPRYPDSHSAGPGPRRRRNCAAAIYRLRQSILDQWLADPNRLPTRHDFHVCCFTVR